MSFFFICGVVCCGVVISSSASCRNPFLSVLPWGFPQELADLKEKKIGVGEVSKKI
jgi:hypothetical protein